jgi:2'-5' RNA ligase
MRLFVGLALSAAAKQRMEGLTLRLRAAEDGLRWTSPEQWHITLVFLGEVQDQERGLLVRELGKLRAAATPVVVEGLGTFERAGILYAAVEVGAALLSLQQAVGAAVKASGLAVEERAYRPHITLARSRNRSGLRTLRELHPVLERQRLRVEWVAEEFLLYASELSPAGSRYRVEQRVRLDG